MKCYTYFENAVSLHLENMEITNIKEHNGVQHVQLSMNRLFSNEKVYPETHGTNSKDEQMKNL